jgi:hypothetical protein
LQVRTVPYQVDEQRNNDRYFERIKKPYLVYTVHQTFFVLFLSVRTVLYQVPSVVLAFADYAVAEVRPSALLNPAPLRNDSESVIDSGS